MNWKKNWKKKQKLIYNAHGSSKYEKKTINKGTATLKSSLVISEIILSFLECIKTTPKIEIDFKKSIPINLFDVVLYYFLKS